ncbi:MAG: hypothetical protein HUJ79_07470, partial [Firmicutes bacterium]|nr:hypothetical protein [Bacillota bacterium]
MDKLNKTNDLLNNSIENDNEIDLLEIAVMLLGKIKYIILITLLGAVIVNGGTYLTVDPTYQSTATLYVVKASSGGVVDLTDLDVGTSLKDDYKVLIKKYPVLSRTINELDLDMTAGTLEKMISIDNPENKRVLSLTVTSTDPVLSRDIANKVAEVSTEYLPKVMKTDAPTIAEKARVSSRKVGPDFSNMLLLGALIGFVLSCAYFIIRHLMDTSVKTGEDVMEILGERPLAAIPYSKPVDTGTVDDKPDLKPTGKYKILHIDTPKLSYVAEEELNRLAVNVKFSGEKIRAIMVTSSIANEGKSFTSVNMWKRLAESGARTVLLDLDLRNTQFKNIIKHQ